MTTLDPMALDDVVHQPVRLAILAILCAGHEADYRFLKASLSVTDGNLSSHLRVLENAGYVQVVKRFVGRRPNSLYSVTSNGAQAFQNYRRILDGIIRSQPPT
jgi:DNA-binding transcriptional ArsR family regulator